MKNNFYVLICCGVFVSSVVAAPVVYDGVGIGAQASPIVASSQMPLNQKLEIVQKSLDNMKQMNFPDKIQVLQRQLQLQQGAIEVLQHKVDALQKQQSLQYQDLVRQIEKNAEKAEATTAPLPSELAVPEVQVPSVISADISPDEQDRRTYQSAYGLVTGRHYLEAIDAFKGYLQIYEGNGRYSANANYWLGELYAQQKQYDKAAASLRNVLTQFPDSNKVPDAILKLGVISVAQGDIVAAKQFYNDVIQKYPDTGSARLAKQQLQQISAQ